MLDSLKQKLDDWASASRPLLDISSEIFPPADVEKLMRKLDVEKQAKKDGENNLPSPEAQAESATEGRISAEFTEISNEYHRQYQGQSDAYKDRYNLVTRWWKMDLIANEEQSLVKDVIAEAKNTSGPVVSEQENLMGAAKQLSRFRQDNQLTHRLPHLHDKWRQLIVILIFLTLEFLASVFLLREAGDLSTLLVLVLVFVLLNTVFPIYFYGPPARWMFFIWAHPFKKVLGILIFFTFSLGGFLLNFFIGHYRAAVMSFEGGDASSVAAAFNQFDRQQQLATNALDSFVNTFWALPDVWSWLLVILNLTLFFYAFYEGIVKDDYYPDYGKLTNIFREAEERYSHLIRQAQDELNGMRKKGIEEINLFKAALTNSFTKAPQLREKHQELYNLCVLRLATLQSHYQAAIAQYRQVNEAHRTKSAPAYFDRSEELNVPIPTFSEIEKIEPDVDKLIGRTEVYVDAVAAEFKLIDEKIKGADNVLAGLHPLRVE